MQRLRQPAIGRLEWAIWPIYVSKQAEKFLHPLVSAMGREILQDSFDQVRMRFEIVILATTIIPYPGVWMRSWREPQKVVRSILNGNGHRFDLLGQWGCSNVRRNWLFHARHIFPLIAMELSSCWEVKCRHSCGRNAAGRSCCAKLTDAAAARRLRSFTEFNLQTVRPRLDGYRHPPTPLAAYP